MIAFSKAANADPTQAANQDRISDNVWITRGNDGGQIYNAKSENVAESATSPAGTRWAVGTADNKDNLSFTAFRDAVGKPKSIVGKNLVMHLVDDDIYIDIKIANYHIFVSSNDHIINVMAIPAAAPETIKFQSL